MKRSAELLCSAFLNDHCLASGRLLDVAQRVKSLLGDDAITATIIENQTSEVIEVDFRGSIDHLAEQFAFAKKPDTPQAMPTKGKRGRPKLGVVAKEVTLLPKHWEWLQKQPGGASATLRKLVMSAQRSTEQEDTQRAAQTAAYKFMTIFASSQSEYEEALRALYAGDSEQFERLIEAWPSDIKHHIREIMPHAFSIESN
ncbi:DUF2239 family protein [Aurantivibrio plasticivorans]